MKNAKKVSARSRVSRLNRQDTDNTRCYTLFLRNLEAKGNWRAIVPLWGLCAKSVAAVVVWLCRVAGLGL